MFGRSHTHHRGVAGGRWKKRAQKTQRIFKPNLHSVLILEDGKLIRVKLASKVIKRVKKDIQDGKKPFLDIIKFMPKEKQKRVFEVYGDKNNVQGQMQTTISA